jgi:hypothetical protein
MRGRLLTTLSAQGAGFAVSLIDRLFVTAILLRLWGVNQFSDWTTLIAAVGMLSFADLGLLFYFGNGFQKTTLEGDGRGFQRMVELSLYCYAIYSLALGALALTAIFAVSPKTLLSLTSLTPTASVVALFILVLYQVSAFARSSISQIYRGYNRYGISLYVGLVPRVLLALFSVGVGFAGGGIVALATAYLIIDLVAGWALMLADLRRRYPEVRFRMSRPTWAELRDVFTHIKWLAISASAPIAWLNIPVLLIAYFGLSGLPLVAFVLTRTMVNLGRQTVQLASVAVGVELADDRFRGWSDGLAARLSAVGAALTSISGAAAAALYLFGPVVLKLWTGKSGLFDGVMMAALLLPAVLVAPLLPLANLMMLSGTPRPPAIAHGVQIVAGLLAGALMIPAFGVTGLAVGLAVGEVLAQCLVFPLVARSAIPLAVYRGIVISIVKGGAAAAWSGIVALLCVRLLAAPSIAFFLVAALAWTVLGLAPPLILALPKQQRDALTRRWLKPRSA